MPIQMIRGKYSNNGIFCVSRYGSEKKREKVDASSADHAAVFRGANLVAMHPAPTNDSDLK
jgi:hypothetical protein